MTELVWKYGLTAPTEQRELVLSQLRLAHEYQCALVRIERGRRARERTIRAEHGGETLAALERAVKDSDTAVLALDTAIKQARKESRKRTEAAEDRARLVEARVAKAAATKALWEHREHYASRCRTCRKLATEARKLNAPEPPIPCEHATQDGHHLLHALDQLGELAAELIRNARGHSGVYWGTYLAIEAAMQASRAMPLYGLDGMTPNDPRFPRFDGGGLLQVRFQGTPLPVGEAMVGVDVLHLTAPPDGAWDHPSYSERHRRARHGKLRMCVLSKDRKPINAEWRLDMDRPLPKDATIREARVVCRRRGPFYKWELQLVLDTSACAQEHGNWSVGDGTAVALDVGWRVKDALRVATLYDGGKVEELVLDAKMLSLLNASKRLRSERDVHLDLAKAEIRRWKDADLAPDWLKQAARECHAWRAASRMSALHGHWIANRFDGDVRAFGLLEAWWWRDRNLWSQESHAAASSLARRKQFYREFAKRLARTYETIVLEKFDLREVARVPKTEDEAANETASGNRTLAAISELRQCVLHAARVYGCRVALVPAERSSHICPDCGTVTPFDAAEHVEFTCSGCAKRWDQDESAARVHRHRWFERPGDAEIVVSARADEKPGNLAAKRGAKWARAKTLRAQKESRMATARETATKSAE
jgi:Putative transposase DNA-binding domain